MAARFFCDHCGTEVKRNSGRCPKCSRLFAFVRCPQCSFTGEEGLFTRGCPSCGYCTPEQKKTALKSQKPSLIAAGKLPLWVYFAAALGLAMVGLALYCTVR